MTLFWPSHHRGYAPGQAKPEGVANQRNGKSAKTVLSDAGALRIDIPCDRERNAWSPTPTGVSRVSTTPWLILPAATAPRCYRYARATPGQSQGRIGGVGG